MHLTGGPAWIGPAITFAILALVMALRLRGVKRARRMRLETLWIVPALFALVFAAMLWEYPPIDPRTWLWLVLALVAGGVIGWRRAKLMRITIDPATHQLNQQSSPAALLFIVLLIVARQGLRYEAASLGLNILQVTGVLTAFALGIAMAARGEVYVRARRLLAEAREGHSASGMSIGPTTSR